MSSVLEEIDKVRKMIRWIDDAKSIAVVSHINMDGDALGSSLAMMITLKRIGKRAFTYIEEEVPDRFDFLREMGGLVMYEGKFVEPHDLLIVVDVADKKLLGKREEMLSIIPRSISIDHHVLRCKYADISYIQPDSAATGELVYDIIEHIGIDLDVEIATCLYVAIATDTGRFKFDNTTPTTHAITSALMTYGINSSWICNKLFDENSKERTLLIAESISTLEMYCDDKIAVMSITRDIINKVGAKDSDVEGIIDFAINIRGVEVGIVVREKTDGTVKASLRSKTFVDVSQIASKFGGGGHIRAAGFTSNKEIVEVKKDIVDCIRGEI